MLAALAVASLAVGATAGCGGIPPDPTRGPSATQAPPALTVPALQSEFDAFAAQHPGELSLAWAPVGAPDKVQTLGTTRDADAWSTIKVPIAVAALGHAGGAEKAPESMLTWVRAAIEWSDNDAAEALYTSLGADKVAEEAVETVLRAAGDTRTEVDPDEGENHGFGRSVWRVEDSARYAAHLPCASGDAAVVYDEMARIEAEQRWGLGALGDRARFKGGWGPSDHGYLVRQIGTLDHDGGRTAVAFLVAPSDDAHETATTTASALATWFAGRLGPADAGTCPGGEPTAPITLTPRPSGTTSEPGTATPTSPTPGSPAPTVSSPTDGTSRR